MTEIVEYIVNGVLPSDKSEAQMLRMKSARYSMFGGHLYRKSFSRPFLRCLGPKAALKMMAKMYESFCGNHLGGRSMAHRIRLQGIYWPTVKGIYRMRDSEKYSRECEQCQRFALLHHVPSNEQTLGTSP